MSCQMRATGSSAASPIAPWRRVAHRARAQPPRPPASALNGAKSAVVAESATKPAATAAAASARRLGRTRAELLPLRGRMLARLTTGAAASAATAATATGQRLRQPGGLLSVLHLRPHPVRPPPCRSRPSAASRAPSARACAAGCCHDAATATARVVARVRASWKFQITWCTPAAPGPVRFASVSPAALLTIRLHGARRRRRRDDTRCPRRTADSRYVISDWP